MILIQNLRQELDQSFILVVTRMEWRQTSILRGASSDLTRNSGQNTMISIAKGASNNFLMNKSQLLTERCRPR